MKKAVWCILFFPFIGCIDQNKPTSGREVCELKMNKNIYDSVQTFVNINVRNNLRSEIYLLKFIDNRSDSVDYVLTTLKKEHISEEYKNSTYFYNKDSSLLIVKNSSDWLFNDSNIGNKLEKLDNVRFLKEIDSGIFNPLIWKLTMVEDKIFIDRFYGAKEAEKNVIIPKTPFRPVEE
jgi:hypothetical protein